MPFQQSNLNCQLLALGMAFRLTYRAQLIATLIDSQDTKRILAMLTTTPLVPEVFRDEGQIDHQTQAPYGRGRLHEVNLRSMHRVSIDDSVAQPRPQVNVDYLSHDWQEEDLWMSFRYLKSSPRDTRNQDRMENALWRTWAQKQRDLDRTNPLTIGWYGTLISILQADKHVQAQRSRSHTVVRTLPAHDQKVWLN